MSDLNAVFAALNTASGVETKPTPHVTYADACALVGTGTITTHVTGVSVLKKEGENKREDYVVTELTTAARESCIFVEKGMFVRVVSFDEMSTPPTKPKTAE